MRGERLGGLHGLRAVAPLKVPAGLHSGNPGLESPRPQSRGPIEACVTGHRCLLVGAALLINCSPWGEVDAAFGPLLLATVEQFSDGDRVIAKPNAGTKLHLRLLGIEAPEIAHATRPSHPCTN